MILAAAIAACIVSSAQAGDDKPASLYERPGGMQAIQVW